VLGLLFSAIIVEQSVTSLKKEKKKNSEKNQKKRGRKCTLLEVGDFGTCTEMYISANEWELWLVWLSSRICDNVSNLF
jgi:hypothetical protein